MNCQELKKLVIPWQHETGSHTTKAIQKVRILVQYGPLSERISSVYVLPTPRRQRAAQATTIAPRWQTLWCWHGPFGASGTLARIFGPRISHRRRTPYPNGWNLARVPLLGGGEAGLRHVPWKTVKSKASNGAQILVLTVWSFTQIWPWKTQP